MHILCNLFLTFSKIGLFTFGGGYTMISMIEHTCVKEKKWISHDDMIQVTVVAESTPGPIAINCATYVGYRQYGFAGALAATLGMIFPSFVMIYLISMFLEDFLAITWISNACKGIKIAVGILILDAAVTMLQKMQKKIFSFLLLGCSFLTVLLVNVLAWNFPSICLMLIAAIISLTVFFVKDTLSQNRSTKNDLS